MEQRKHLTLFIHSLAFTQILALKGANFFLFIKKPNQRRKAIKTVSSLDMNFMELLTTLLLKVIRSLMAIKETQKPLNNLLLDGIKKMKKRSSPVYQADSCTFLNEIPLSN